jgi:transcriptional regulator with XRE-family HTH domain
MSLGDNIKNARIKKGLSQKELADLISNENIKFGNTAISNWENGTSKPDADTLCLLCGALGVDANYLLGWEEMKATEDIKDRLKQALKENDFFEGEDLSEENFDKLLKFIERNKDFIIDKK